MGQPKMVLPWGRRTVIGQVVDQIIDGGVNEIIVVAGGAKDLVEAALKDFPVQIVENPKYENGEMLDSLKVGLRQSRSGWPAALVALGDQPQIRADVVKAVIHAYQATAAGLVIPSYQKRRGHPWMIDRALWSEIFDLEPPSTLRDFLSRQQDRIHYVNLEDATILADLDTPEEYERQRPVD
jgi:molybdenum cofactor cytidylyltransferase